LPEMPFLQREDKNAPFWDGCIWRSLKPSSEFQIKVSSMLASENSNPSQEGSLPVINRSTGVLSQDTP
jgi:hypothetical protein